MGILVVVFGLFLGSFAGAETSAGNDRPFLQPEFDWKAWERLSQEEKERNVLWQNKNHPDHCEPLVEYKEAIDFFRTQKEEINPTEGLSRTLAGEISKGCKGAAQRFKKAFLILKNSGVYHAKSIEYALKFAVSDDETLENFSELFKKTYLGEYFDLDYSLSLKLSFELSVLYKGNRPQAREDFLEISRFCLSDKELNLPAAQCAELALSLTRLSQYYPDGIRKEFFSLYKILREDRRFGVSILTALRISLEVLPYGPTAPQTFLKSYEYAINPLGLASGGIEAVKFAVVMSKNALRKWPPPVYTPPKFIEANPEIHKGYQQKSTYESDAPGQRQPKSDSSSP